MYTYKHIYTCIHITYKHVCIHSKGLRGNHLSNTTCLTQVFFNGEPCSMSKFKRV